MTKLGRLIQRLAVAVLWLTVMASAAHAHGGIAGPDELGPPVITSVVLGVACYWAVLLWPSRRENDAPKVNRVARRAVR
jgi:hypothetical protein